MSLFKTWYWMYKRGDKKTKTMFWAQLSILAVIAILVFFSYGKAMKTIMNIVNPSAQ